MHDSFSDPRGDDGASVHPHDFGQQSALIELAGLFIAGADAGSAFRTLTAIVASTLRVSRASVWQYNAGRSHIDCLDLYEHSSATHGIAASISRSSCPAYFEALRTGAMIVAPDARTDPRTSELTVSYLAPLDIFSILDAPFKVAGEVEGVLCCEQTGHQREWSHDEVTFMVAVAQVLSRLVDALDRTRIESVVRLRSAALNAATDAVSIVAPDGRVVWANDAYANLMLHVGERIDDAAPQDQLAVSSEAGPDFGRVFSDAEVLERQVTRANGARRYVGHQTVSPIRNSSGEVEHAVVIERDLAPQRSLEAQLQQAQRMEAVGQLTGGIAHDFNNLLTIIGGHAALLANAPSTSALAQKGLREIVHASGRATALIRQLLAFSRPHETMPEVLDLNVILQDIAPLVARALGVDVRLTLELAPEGTLACIDRVQFEQVVMNIAVNARAAMPHGGVFGLTTDVVAVSTVEAVRGAWPAAPGQDLVRLRLRDTGCGMTEEVRVRIFEPFFSTRAKGEGSGLGLSTVHAIVTQNGGHVHVESTPGLGSTFTVYLPRAHAAPATQHPAPASLPHRGDETILVVDDDPAVRNVTVSLLRRAGYHVVEAEAPGAATRIAATVRGTIDLLLTDVTMPEATGAMLYQELVLERPQLRVVFMSGYPPDTPRSRTDVPMPSFLSKPFSQGSLLQTVREALDA